MRDRARRLFGFLGSLIPAKYRGPIVGASAVGASVAASLGLDGPAATVATGAVAALAVVGGLVVRRELPGRDTDGDGVPDWIQSEAPGLTRAIRTAQHEADSEALDDVRDGLRALSVRAASRRHERRARNGTGGVP